MKQLFGVGWYRFRATFRSRRSSYLGVVLVVGLVGGVAMGAVAGARRTEASFPTYLASTNPSTAMVFSGFDDPALGLTTGYNPKISRTIAHLPLVDHAATAIGFDGNINLSDVTGIHPHTSPGETPPTVTGSLDGEYATEDAVTLERGRLAQPGRADEAVMNLQAAKELGVHVGSIIHVPFTTDAENNSSGSSDGKPHLVANIKLVGEVVFNNTVVEDDIDELGSGTVLLSPALTRELADCCAYYAISALQIRGGEANAARVEGEVNHVLPSAAAQFGSQDTSLDITKAQRAIRPEAIALAVFGGIAGLAVLLIAALMVGRILRAGVVETSTLRALGAGRGMAIADGLLGLVGALLVGSLLAVAVAVGLSPLAPLGPVRPVYPNPGVAFDWVVLGSGFLVLIIVSMCLALIFAAREVNQLALRRRLSTWRPESGVVRSAASSGLPVSTVTGLRFALESGRGRDAVPVRSAIFGAVIAVVVLVTTITFGASLNNLVSHPALYGWNWNYVMFSGFAGSEDLPHSQITSLLDQDPEVAKWSGVSLLGAEFDGQGVPVLTELPGASVAPPLLSGHGLDASNQVVLGGTTLKDLHKQLGDTVTFSNGVTKPRRLRIVGTATMASIASGLEMGSGALVSTSDFPASLLNPQQDPISGPNAILVRIRPGVSSSVALRSLDEVDKKVNAIPGDGTPAGGVVSVLRPAEIVNYRSMGTTPALLGTGLVVGAVFALGLTLVVSVRRRRRDLALLKALGFTQRQLAAAVAWQSSVAVAIGTIVGVPLGIVIGRLLWDLFAHQINAVPVPTVPTLSIALIIVGAIVLANIVAAIPGRMAARTPTALVLRAE